MSLFVNDDWRWKPRLTITLGLRDDLITPFTQPERQMANLDVDQAFNHVAVVQPGETGAYSGVYPAALVHADGNNVSPRVAGAWRANSRTTARFGYSILYNGGTYASIARSLYSQAPSFINLQSTGTSAVPLPYTVALLAVRPSTVTESYGIDKDYRLGMIQQFNVDISRDLFKTYQVGATWVGSIGRDLDVWLAPNQGPDGLRLQGVQSYLYEQSGGHSHANSLSARFQKRQSHGVAGTVNYTWQRARDNTTATSGGSTPAQNYADLDAEWAPSSFNRTNVVTGNGTVQLPWGANRHWLPSGGALAAIFGDWTLSGTVSLQSGTPLTALCACSNITAGAGSTLRADLVPGQTIALSDPVVGRDSVQFFNASAFTAPAAGTFGTATRNQITGPGSHQMNLNVVRDLRFSHNRTMTLQALVANPLNFVNYLGVDTNVNSRTFGQVLSVGQMRSARVSIRFRF